MLASCRKSRTAALVVLSLLAFTFGAAAQVGTSALVTGTVSDPSGALVPNAVVEIHNPVSGFTRTAKTDASGKYTLPNVPFNNYHLTATAAGFAPFAQDINPRSTVPLNLPIQLALQGSSTSVEVEASTEDLLEKTPTFHTDVDRDLIQKLPLESPSSSVSSLVTLATPGIAADSNGLFHGMGDHAENSFVVDGQPITDQQSKVFSNQIPVDSVESMEVIAGAPPAEYGDKTSVVINVTTRSGLGVKTPTGSVTTSYGSFGTSTADFNLAYGGQNWGNFISVGGLNTGRFLDPPEFTVMHAKGNEENVFDRIDFQPSVKDSLRFNLGFTRSWFQTPNSFDQQDHSCAGLYPEAGLSSDCVSGFLANPVTGAPLGPADQRSQIRTFNLAPSWTRTLSDDALFTLGTYVRHDEYNYYPSNDPLDDFSPDLQNQSFGQDRTLTNAGVRGDYSYVKGMHNIKAGAYYDQTFLTENDSIGIVNPTYLGSLVQANGSPCVNASGVAMAAPCTTLVPYDLTTGTGTPYQFHGHTDVKQLALYVQDAITKGPWSFNLGMRGDLYSGITNAQMAEPRLGAAYNIKRTGTVLQLSYARIMETPFNENLILASTGCLNPVLNPLPGVPQDSLILCSSGSSTPINPGRRNEYHAGLQQAFGRYVVVSGEYVWKYTHNAYDFSVLGNTPLTFPIEWTKSKITGVAGRVNLANFHGLTAFTVFSSVAARFFEPQIGGAGATPLGTSEVFRIDHDEVFNQTTHVQYQPWKKGPWLGFTWRFDSGLVAGATPCYNPLSLTCAGASTTLNGLPAIAMIDTNTGLPLTADQEFQAGFTCNGVGATPTRGLPFVCPASQFGSPLIKVPAPGTQNDDHNPQRIAPRNLFDLAIGHDNLFHGDKYKWSAQFTVINLANQYSLYNFLSTFSGTHYVTPRTLTAQIGFHF